MEPGQLKEALRAFEKLDAQARAKQIAVGFEQVSSLCSEESVRAHLTQEMEVLHAMEA